MPFLASVKAFLRASGLDLSSLATFFCTVRFVAAAPITLPPTACAFSLRATEAASGFDVFAATALPRRARVPASCIDDATAAPARCCACSSWARDASAFAANVSNSSDANGSKAALVALEPPAFFFGSEGGGAAEAAEVAAVPTPCGSCIDFLGTGGGAAPSSSSSSHLLAAATLGAAVGAAAADRCGFAFAAGGEVGPAGEMGRACCSDESGGLPSRTAMAPKAA
mmetsp:Transcript_235/g.736  ORF Transcript_235/g.736 Transcript_235/m.736 type:complete len:226 (+) Transcript_235:1348-2025(+)